MGVWRSQCVSPRGLLIEIGGHYNMLRGSCRLWCSRTSWLKRPEVFRDAVKEVEHSVHKYVALTPAT